MLAVGDLKAHVGDLGPGCTASYLFETTTDTPSCLQHIQSMVLRRVSRGRNSSSRCPNSGTIVIMVLCCNCWLLPLKAGAKGAGVAAAA